jgi:curli production assembly/transport component CsgG
VECNHWYCKRSLVFAGFGFGTNKIFENRHSKIQYGAGLEYLVSSKKGIKAFAEQNINFSDTIDYLERGVRDDYYFRFGVETYLLFSN